MGKGVGNVRPGGRLAGVEDVVIPLRPEDERGREILDAFEQQEALKPMQVIGDGTRRYRLQGEDVDVDSLDPVLSRIDPNWRSHITTWR